MGPDLQLSDYDLDVDDEKSDDSVDDTEVGSVWGNHLCCCGLSQECKRIQYIFESLAAVDSKSFSHRVGFVRLPKPNNGKNQTIPQKNRNKRAALFAKYLGVSAKLQLSVVKEPRVA